MPQRTRIRKQEICNFLYTVDTSIVNPISPSARTSCPLLDGTHTKPGFEAQRDLRAICIRRARKFSGEASLNGFCFTRPLLQHLLLLSSERLRNRCTEDIFAETVVHFGCLSFAGSCGGAVRASSSNGTVALLVQLRGICSFAWIGQRKGAHGDQSFSASVPSWSPLDGLFPVGREIERDEEQQIRAEDDQACDSSELFASASAYVGHP